MQNFQPILIAIGVLAIVGVLIHGFLLGKREQESTLPEQYDELDEEQIETHDEPYVTTVESDKDAMEFYGISDKENDGDIDDFELLLNDEDIIEKESPAIDVQELLLDTSPDLSFIEKDISDEELESDILVRNELNSDELDTVKLNHEELKDVKLPQQEPLNNIETIPPISQQKIEEPKDLFIFNVVARDNSKLGGHELLQFFLTSGFRYGHMNIFHRHENSDGTGEVLFSIANMMAPGTFDLDTMEQFQSQGISFFLTAPNDNIDIKKAFDLMLRAVVQIADEFNCDVLNEQRGTLTEAQFIEYRSRLLQYT